MSEATLDQLEILVESFELARTRADDTDLREFFPPESDPDYTAVALELMRVDLEGRWKIGSPRRLEEYCDAFDDVLRASDRMAALAFEEYRCRVQAGEDASPQEYARRFGITTHDWPTPTSLRFDPNEVDTIESMSALGESTRLVNSIQRFPCVGDRLAGFRLIETLGQGTFATVFLAREDDLAERFVVLKVSSDASLEPQHLARLQHTNIVPIYSLHHADKLHAVCMPFFGRTTLANILRRLRSSPSLPTSGQFLVDEISAQHSVSNVDAITNDGELQRLSTSTYVDACIRLLLQVAEGLEHAHQRGILHRDIKPANILITDEGRPMLLDFNVSDEIVVGGRSSLLVGGTLPYMSPEQRRAMISGAAIDQRSDVYSFGVLCHELICGELPVTSADTQSGLDGLGSIGPEQRTTAASVRTRSRNLPHSLAALVARCLHPDREQRYQSITDVRDDLRRHLDHRPLKHASDRNPRERLSKWCRRHPRLASATSMAAIGSVIALVLVSLLVFQAKRSRHYQAIALSDSVSRQLPELRVLFGAKELEDGEVDQMRMRVEDLLAEFDLGPEWKSDPLIAPLSEQRQGSLRDSLAELCYLAAAADLGRADNNADDERIVRARLLNQTARSLFASDRVPLGLTLQQSALAAADATPDWTSDVPTNVTWQSNHRQMIFVHEMIRRGHYRRAAVELESLREEQPLDYSTWFLLGNAYAAQSRFSEAESCFTTCGLLWPKSIMAWFHRGICRLQAGQFAAAEADFDHVLRERQDHIPALFNRALCRKGVKDYAGAVADLGRVIELQGQRPRALLVRARVFDLMGESQQAAADRELALQREPIDARGWMARALARVETQPKMALEDLKQAQRGMQHERDIQRSIAYVLGEHLDETEESAELLSDLFDRYGKPEDLMAYGVMLARLGRHDDAVQAGQQALQAHRTPKLSFQMACILALNVDDFPEDAQLAVGLLAEAISLEPQWLGKAMSDSDLDRIRSRSEFRSVIRSAVRLQTAARHARRNQQDGETSTERESAETGE